MVKINTPLAALALLVSTLVTAAPVLEIPEIPDDESFGNATRIFRSKAEGAVLPNKAISKEFVSDASEALEKRQIPAFGAYWEHWDFQGASQTHRAPIDGRGYYIGDAWNDRISSIWNYDFDKKCSYWTHWDWNHGGYCWGEGLIFAGRTSEARLGAPWNDAFSCLECSWN